MTLQSAPYWWVEDQESGCWVWLRSRNNRGYGQVRVRSAEGIWRTVYAHRHRYEQRHGPIPDGMHVLHHCDNPPCVNPDHLFLGTQSDNMLDMYEKGRRDRTQLAGATLNNALKEACKRGHPFDSKNTYVTPRGNRECRACNALRQRERRASK